MVVERSLRLLKGRFRKLKTLMDVDRVAGIPEIIVEACILHNICLIEDYIDGFLDDTSTGDDNDSGVDDIFPPAAAGTDKRNMIMTQL